MRIPADAEVPAEKLSHYLLVPRPWDDKAKFLAQAGFDRERSETLLRALRELAAHGDAVSDGANEHGEFLRLDGIGWAERAAARRDNHLASPAHRRSGAVCDPEAPQGERPMKPPLYERVALTQDLDESGLRRGDVWPALHR